MELKLKFFFAKAFLLVPRDRLLEEGTNSDSEDYFLGQELSMKERLQMTRVTCQTCTLFERCSPDIRRGSLLYIPTNTVEVTGKCIAKPECILYTRGIPLSNPMVF